MAGGEVHPLDELGSVVGGANLPIGGSWLGAKGTKLVREEWARNHSNALAAAELSAGMQREDLIVALEQHPETVPLYLCVLMAAGMNGHDKTLHAMGAVLGTAIKASRDNDRDRFGDAELALRAMGDLSTRHFQVLDALSESVVIVTKDGGEVYSEFTPEFVAARAGLSLQVTGQCLNNLVGAGLARSLSVLDAIAFPMTDLGRAVLEAAEAL